MTCNHQYYWYPAAANEEGWKCYACDDRPGEPPGFDPVRDREDIYGKVAAILNDLHDQKFIYVSNGSAGDGITSRVATMCEINGAYDQLSIIQYILQLEAESHRSYWRKISNGVVNGNDQRERCCCGSLATSFSSGVRWCDECRAKSRIIRGTDKEELHD